MSGGPIIRVLEIVSIVAGLCAVAALVFALAAFSGRLETIQTSRQESALDSCYGIRALVLDNTPTAARGNEYLRRAGFGDCRAYSRKARGDH